MTSGPARDCLADPCGTLRRGLLTSAFALVIGLERMFHLDQMEDAGFARLTGGRRCPSRYWTVIAFAVGVASNTNVAGHTGHVTPRLGLFGSPTSVPL